MTPVLYILMRTDLPTMNAGKAMAQASHASNAFIHMARGDLMDARAEMTKAWQSETKQGFGTVLVLGATRAELVDVVSKARQQMLAASVIDDPTYPYRVESGEIASLIPEFTDTVPRVPIVDMKAPVTLYRSEMTCGFVFADKDDLATAELVGHLKLHP